MSKKSEGTVRLPQAIALYIGAVLGSGILIVPGLAAQMAGPASLTDWGMMLILVLPLSMCMAFLAQKYPHAGGVSHFVTLAFGSAFGNLVGWFFLMSIPIGAPVAALTGAGYLCSALNLSANAQIIAASVILLFAVVLNYIGMRFAGKVQVGVVVGIICVLLLAIVGAIPNMERENFQPFMPHGITSVGFASTILFWCFIGWEAVSHLSEEFVNPKKDVMKATVIAAVLIGILYFATAVAVVGTKSYGHVSQASLVIIAEKAFGPFGGILIGFVSLLICLATVIAYIGAASRLAYSLALNGYAPKWFSIQSKKFATPKGGLFFLTLCFTAVMGMYALHIYTLTELIQLPNATFLLTYLSGCAAGVVLFKKQKQQFLISFISLLATIIMFLFVGKAIIYPLIIVLFFTAYHVLAKRGSVFLKRKRDTGKVEKYHIK
ncbi:APC family permease [Heyndrickxia ginsengihumi]|uniref:APC family permease n=1 Tax=Heyndrickxia ginsengihumi TaxID=363870 RepID=UPI00203CE594|nr:amino acid permease [Heyndrickxia ginsengihumi]MCM3024990.1 amino acid permease [Heyndrickxia ginsengihumi]